MSNFRKSSAPLSILTEGLHSPIAMLLRLLEMLFLEDQMFIFLEQWDNTEFGFIYDRI